MAGGLKSRDCQPCKARRTRCDQNWPICTQCIRTRRACPGPSSLIKFVTTTKTRAKPSTAAVIPRPAPTPRADHLAGRLAHHLGSPAEGRLTLQVFGLEHLPVRLAESPCLQDCAALLCTVWNTYRRREPQLPFLRMPEYGKAIGSLARTLASKKAFTVETLASITVLQQTELLFDPGNSHYQHEKGALALLSTIGPPKLEDDKFYARMALENYSDLVPYWAVSGRGSTLNSREWANAISTCLADYIGDKRLKEFIDEGLKVHNAFCTQLPRLVQAVNAASASAQASTASNAADITRDIQKLTFVVELASSMQIDTSKEVGMMGETPDPDSPFGTKYWCSPPRVTQFIIGYLNSRLIILLLSLKWYSIHKHTDQTVLLASVRAACLEIWKFIPFLRDLDLFSATTPRRAMILSFGFATPEEKEYMLDIFSELGLFTKFDASGRKVPISRASIEEEISRLATSFFEHPF